MELEDYIQQNKEIYNLILKYLDNISDSEEENDQLFNEIQEKQNHLKEKEELVDFLLLLNGIYEYHHRCPNFISKLELILKNVIPQIKQTLSNSEIYKLFKYSKSLLLYLVQNEILTFEQYMLDQMNVNRSIFFFYPEIEKVLQIDKNLKMPELNREPYTSEDFEEKRRIGENDSYICSLIREDSVEEFITYVNRTNYPLKSEITESIFETNSLIIENNITPIDYALFFGSFQIVKYLQFSGIEFNSKSWLFTIHGRNAELIHFLEENKIAPPDKNFEMCFNESIKCHHNEIALYIQTNYLYDQEKQEKKLGKFCDNIYSNCLKYHNYELLPDEFFSSYFVLLYLIKYDHLKLFKLFVKDKNVDINATIDNIIFFIILNDISISFNIGIKIISFLNSISNIKLIQFLNNFLLIRLLFIILRKLKKWILLIFYFYNQILRLIFAFLKETKN